MVASGAVGERRLPLTGLVVLGLIGAVAGLQLAAASGASSPSTLRDRADALRAENGSLTATERATWLGLVSLETRLEASQAALVRLTARRRAIAARRAEADFRLGIARRALRISEQRLASRLRALYEHGDADPLSVLLGASSLAEAIEGLESLDRAAGQDKDVVAQLNQSRAKLIRLTRALAAREAEARRAQEAAAATAAALAQAKRERSALLAQLRSQRQANSTNASSLDSQARALASRIAPVAGTARTAAPAPIGGAGTLTVTATGYALPGTTATGVPVGWGIVAVDPSVIPLGTRMTIPGYGEGVAADTGGEVVGAKIDLWFPTRAEALAWGSRTVTITLH